MISIKDEVSWHPLFDRLYHPKMLEVFVWICRNLKFKKIITSTYRLGDRGVHGTMPCRGLDLRSKHLPEKKCREIEREINQKWSYDSDRKDMKVCLYHKTKHGAYHFHIQVHDRTRRR